MNILDEIKELKEKLNALLKQQLSLVANALKFACLTITCDECPFSDGYAYCKLADESREMSEEECTIEICNYYKNKAKKNNRERNKNVQTRN